MGTKTKVTSPRTPGSAVRWSSSRRSWKPASLPSISPGWIPASANTTGRPRRRAFSGVRTPSSLAASTHSGRPSPLVPKRWAWTRPRKRRGKFRASVSTSAAGPLSTYAVRSACVFSGSVGPGIGPRSVAENSAQREHRLKRAFVLQEPPLAGKASPEPGEAAVRADDPVAGNDHRHGVLPVRRTDRPGRARIAELRGQASVGPGGTGRDAPECLPGPPLELGAVEADRDGRERVELPLEETAERSGRT